jgi:hypothetical protein
MAEFAAPFRLPRDVLMKIEGCDGKVDAFYDEGEITTCYEYIEYIYQNTPREPVMGGLRPEDAVVGPMVDLVLHELVTHCSTCWISRCSAARRMPPTCFRPMSSSRSAVTRRAC